MQQRAAVCCCGPGGQEISIDSDGHPAATAPTSTAVSSKAGSVTLSADV